MKAKWPFLTTYFVICRIILLLLLVSSPTNANSMKDSDGDRLNRMEFQIHQLNRKNILLGLKNDHQDKEIGMLKTLVSKIASKQTNDDDEIITAVGDALTQQKRPARLLPPHMLFAKKERKPMTILEGPPASCKDLDDLGHTLNGIFLLVDKKSSSTLIHHPKPMVVNAIYCDFQGVYEHSSSSSPKIKATNLGFVNMKTSLDSSGIFFYVQIGNRSPTTNGVLHFDHQVSNIGDGMDLKQGVFTAPKAGVYTFSFSILKNPYSYDYLEVILRLNEAQIGMSSAGNGFFGAPATLQSTLKLVKGDRIDLLKSHGDLNRMCDSYCHHFTGSLMEEDSTANIIY